MTELPYDALRREIGYLMGQARRAPLQGSYWFVSTKDLEEALERVERVVPGAARSVKADGAMDNDEVRTPEFGVVPLSISCFWGHAYGRWTEPVERWHGPPINSMAGRREVIRIQERTCSRCGRIDQRVLA